MERYHKQFLSQLSSTDKILHTIVKQQGPILLPSTDSPFRHLIRIVTGQQLNTKVAATIYKRVENHVGIGYLPTDILNTKDEEFRTLGLSKSKTSYIKAVADAAGFEEQNFDDLGNLSDEDVLKQLIAIRGIGTWSAQMFLMFQLKRPDVFAPGDFGLRKSMSILYGYSIEEKEQFWEKIASHWSPYRTLASLHLWKYLDKK